MRWCHICMMLGIIYSVDITWSLLEAWSIRVFILLELHEVMAFFSLISSSAKFWSDTSARIKRGFKTFWQLEDARRSLFETICRAQHRWSSIGIDGIHTVLIFQHRKWSSCTKMHERNPTILQAFIAINHCLTWSENCVCNLNPKRSICHLVYEVIDSHIPHFFTPLNYQITGRSCKGNLKLYSRSWAINSRFINFTNQNLCRVIIYCANK